MHEQLVASTALHIVSSHLVQRLLSKFSASEQATGRTSPPMAQSPRRREREPLLAVRFPIESLVELLLVSFVSSLALSSKFISFASVLWSLKPA